MLREAELEDSFERVVSELLADPSRMEELSRNILALARPEATREIADEIEKLVKDP
jgi:UDP-N-acetylglucosamine--N-acetylmuramyl-(pentapeptide) pyrophosphoryl-undecaprenol N-acetylglucosamine transferase